MVFKSKLIQNGESIDATELYKDIEKAIEEEKKEINTEKLDRRHPLQHILNSTSGGYVSPTSMKSFELCPAGYLYNKLVPEKVGSATSIGNTVHSILCRWYEGENRSIDELNLITEEVIKEDNQIEKADDVKLYIKGYLDADDYLGGSMNHQELKCSTETFIKPVAEPLGIKLGVPIYTLVDRIDVRDSGIYVIDYKTGWGDPNPYLLGEHGYLPQMIFYKWAVEAEYGQEIKKSFLCLPGASKEFKYVEMNVNSLVEQSKVIEKIMYHLDHIRNIREIKIFPETIMRYCNSCQMKMLCNKYRASKGLENDGLFEKIPVKIEY